MGWWSDFKSDMAGRISRFQNATFKEAMLAGCALMTAADGKIDPAEKSKVAKYVGSADELKAFDAADLRDTYLAYCDQAGDEFTRNNMLNKVRKLKGDEAASDTCLRVVLVIANADGDFADAEKKVVKELCQILGVDSASYLAG